MRRRERGVALVMVILVLLILTVLGITAVTMMTQEDKISSRQALQKAAFYSAEVGLRLGEKILIAETPHTNSNLNIFLGHAPQKDCPATSPTRPQHPAASLPPNTWTVANLGTYLQASVTDATELSNQEVTEVMASGADPFTRVRSYYSLYVRNNPEDVQPGTVIPDPTHNWDSRLRLIAVGFVTDNNGVDGAGNGNVLAVSIQEEELNFAGGHQGGGGQADQNAGATNSGHWSGSAGGGT